MSLNPRKPALLLCIAAGLFVHETVAQTSDSGKNAAGAGTTAQPQTLGDLARKSKQKDQQDQTNNSPPPDKPKVYTEDNLGAVRGEISQGAKPSTQTPSAKSESKPPAVNLVGNKAAITMFEVEKSTVKRPSSVRVNWQIQNTSDQRPSPPYGPFTFTLTFTVTGPCNYKSTMSETVDLMIGEGRADTMLANPVFLESDCPGAYELELSVTSGGKLLKAARGTVNIL
jgi:hypothetical protein